MVELLHTKEGIGAYENCNIVNACFLHHRKSLVLRKSHFSAAAAAVAVKNAATFHYKLQLLGSVSGCFGTLSQV